VHHPIWGIADKHTLCICCWPGCECTCDNGPYTCGSNNYSCKDPSGKLCEGKPACDGVQLLECFGDSRLVQGFRPNDARRYTGEMSAVFTPAPVELKWAPNVYLEVKPFSLVRGCTRGFVSSHGTAGPKGTVCHFLGLTQPCNCAATETTFSQCIVLLDVGQSPRT